MKPRIATAVAIAVAGTIASVVTAGPLARQAVAQPVGTARKAAPAGMHLVPADTALVLSIDVAASKRGPLFPRVLRLLDLSEELGRGLELLRAGADIDARRNVTRVTVAIAADFPTSQRVVYLLDGTFDPSKLAAFAKRDSKAATALSHRGITYYRLGGKAEVAMLGGRLIIARKGGGSKMIDLHVAGRRAARPSTRLRATVATVGKSGVVWAAFAVPAKLRAQLAAKLDGHAIDSIAVNLSVGTKSSLHMVLRLDTATPSAAVAIATMIRSALPGLAKLGEAKKLRLNAALAAAKVSRSRTTVELTLSLGPVALLGLRSLLSH